MDEVAIFSCKELNKALVECNYLHVSEVHRDVMEVVTTLGKLEMKIDTHVSNTGVQRKLVCLNGTIPVNYKERYYHIPLCIWLSLAYPDLPPLVYVRPTQDMVLVPGSYVDQAGMVSLPYIEEWDEDNSDLSGLIQILCAVFAENIPVFSRRLQIEPPVEDGVRADRVRARTDGERVRTEDKQAVLRGKQTTTEGEMARTREVLPSERKQNLNTFNNDSSLRLEDYTSAQSMYDSGNRPRCDSLTKRKEALLRTVDDVIATSKLLINEAESIISVTEVSRTGLANDSVSTETLNAVEDYMSKASVLQKSLRSTLEQTRKATERVMTDIKDYEALRRRWEGERKTLKRQEEPKVTMRSYKDWSTDDVCVWFNSIGFGEYIPFIIQNRIRGVHLPELSKDDMIELGIKKLGDRITLDNEINKICSTVSNIL